MFLMAGLLIAPIANAVESQDALLVEQRASNYATGPKRMTVATNRRVQRTSEIVFTLRNLPKDAEDVQVCHSTPEIGEISDTPLWLREDCQDEMLETSFHPDGSWKVRQATGGWQIRWLVEPETPTKLECAQIEYGYSGWGSVNIYGGKDRRREYAFHEYTLECLQWGGLATGKKTLNLSATKKSRLRIKHEFVDAAHQADNARSCHFDGIPADGGYWYRFWCIKIPMSQLRKTEEGWTARRILTYEPAGSAFCEEAERWRPQRTMKLYLRKGKKTLASSTHVYTLDCR